MRRMRRMYKTSDSPAGTPVALHTSPDVSQPPEGSSISDLNMNRTGTRSGSGIGSGSGGVEFGNARESAPATTADTSTSTLRRRISSVDTRTRSRFRLFRRRERGKQASESPTGSPLRTVGSGSATPTATGTGTGSGNASAVYSYAGFRGKQPERECEYEARVLRPEPPHSRIQLCDLPTRGRLVRVAEEVAEPVRIHDNHVSFIVPHGWIATRTEWGFYLSSKLCIGFVMAVGAKDATRELVNTDKLCVFSEVVVLASPVFESKHKAVVNYAAHDIAGRG